MNFQLTAVHDNAFNAFKVARIYTLHVVKEVRQTITSLDVKLHVTFDLAILFHVRREKSENET